MGLIALFGILWAGPLTLIQLRHVEGYSLLQKKYRDSLKSELDRTDGVLLAISCVSFVCMVICFARA